MTFKLRLLLVGFILTNVLLLSGCNTAHGFGQDIKSGGQAIENASSK